MFKRYLISFFIIFSIGVSQTYSQRVKIRMYPAKKDKKKDPAIGGIDYANQDLAYGITFHRKRKQLLAIPHKIKNFKPTGDELVISRGRSMKIDGFKMRVHPFYPVYPTPLYYEWQNGLLALFQGHGPTKDYGVAAVFIDSTLNVDPPMLLTSIDLHGIYNWSYFRYIPSLEIKIENDHLLIEFETNRFIGEKGFREYAVFDKDLKIVQQNQYKASKLAKDISIEDRYISPNGDYVLVARVFNRKKGEKKSRKSTWPYQIFRFKQGYRKPEKVSFDLGQKYIGAIKLIEYQNQLALAGIYGESKKTFDGLWFATLDPETFEITNQTTRSFTSISLSEAEEENNEEDSAPRSNRAKKNERKVQGARKGRRGVLNPQIPVTRIIENPDGSAYVIGEEHWETTKCDSKGNCTTINHNGRLIVIFLDPNGEPSWTRTISKYGLGHYPDGNYNYVECSQGPLLIIEEHSGASREVDYPMKKSKNMSAINRGKVSAILLTPDGELNKFVMINNQQKKVRVNPWNMYQADDDIFYFGYKKKKKYGVGRLEIKF